MIRSMLGIFGLILAATPASASNYSAVPVDPTPGRFITRDISWKCNASACQGATEESRPMVLCESLAKRAGRLASFFVDGRPFTPAELDRCNGRARPAPATSLVSH